MGRFVLMLIALNFCLDSYAQGALQSASVHVELSKEQIHIFQTFHLDLPDTMTQVQLRALHFDHLHISDFTIQSDHFKVIKNDLEPSKLYSCLLYTSPSPRDRG